MATFEQALKEKFEAGRKEHNQPWDAEHIDAVREMKDEWLDIYHYASLLKDEELKREIQGECKYNWKRLDYIDK